MRARPSDADEEHRPSRLALLRVGLRRFVVVLVAIAAGSGVLGLALGALAGSSWSRSLSLAWYVVGVLLLVAGFFFGNRGPARPRGSGAVPLFGSRFVRWATPEETEDALATSAVFVAIGVALVLLGIAADPRTELF